MSHPISLPAKVVVYGDSITEAMDLPEPERSNAWVTVVQADSGGKLKMINEGKGGRPTDSMPEFRATLQRHDAIDLLVLALGGNDARDITEACVPKAVQNLTEMITLARQTYGESLPILLVAPTNIRKDTLGPTRPIANEREAKLIELGAAYRLLAPVQRCHVVSLYGSLPMESLTLDGVHPDSAGHRRIADIMLPALLRIVSDCQS